MTWSTDSSEAVLAILPKIELAARWKERFMFGIIEGAFEVFDPNKMYAKVSNFIYPQQHGS